MFIVYSRTKKLTSAAGIQETEDDNHQELNHIMRIRYRLVRETKDQI